MKPIILFDLDGTIADCSHRRHFLEETPKNWDAFFGECMNDPPVTHTVALLRLLNRENLEIWITSARPDSYLHHTVLWLSENQIPYDNLIMRKVGDQTDDGILKVSWLDNQIPRSRVLFAFDDRDRVVKSWRASGIPCFQVSEGDF